MKKKILITGGCGFVGKNIANYFNKKYELFIIDNLSSGNKKDIPKNIKIYNLDIQKYDDLLKIFKKNKFHTVIHCAANFANQNSIDNIFLDTKSNILGTINILELSRKHSIKKFIYLSSSCIYQSPKSSEDIINPSFKTPYAISKFSAEQYVSFYNDYYNFNATSLRLYNFYGPYDYVGKYRNVIPNFIDKALKNKTINIHGTGSSTRDFTFVFDFILFLEKIIKNPKKYNKIYNFGSSSNTKIIDLAYKILKLTNSKSRINSITARKWDKFSKRKANNKRLIKDFKDIKFTDINNGLIQTIDWMKKQ